jgi:hypothetical protein
MITWAYRTLPVSREARLDAKSLSVMVAEMNAMGSDGWEAFSVIGWETGWWVFFRRPTETTSSK